MKNIILIILLSSVCFMLNSNTLTINRAIGEINIDGVNDEYAWTNSKYEFIENSNGYSSDLNNTATFAMLYDEKFLYVFVNIKDANIDTSQSKLDWEKDCVELYFRMDTSYSEYFDKTKASMFRKVFGRKAYEALSGKPGERAFYVAEKITSGGYTQEWLFNIDSLVKYGLFNKRTFRFEIINNDNDGQGRRSQLFWNYISCDECSSIGYNPGYIYFKYPLDLKSTPNKPDLVISKTGESPVIDGIEDDIWNNTEWLKMELNKGDLANKNNTASFKMIHDDNFLYVLVDVKDAVIDTSQSKNVWEKDCVELYFVWDTNSYANCLPRSFLYLRKVYGRPLTDYASKGFIAAEQHTSTGYTQEWRLSLDSLISTSNKNYIFNRKDFKFEICNSDNDGKGRNSQLFWKEVTDNCFCVIDPQYFGLMSLSSDYLDITSSNLNNSVSCYPNPASEKIQLKSVSKISEVEIYTLNGQLILNRKVGDNETSIKLDRISNGLYILKAFTDSGISTLKILINR